MMRKILVFAMFLFLGLATAGSSGNTLSTVDYSDPVSTQCNNTGNIVDFTCGLMVALLTLGPFVAIIALVAGGLIYVYANVFVTADQRGRYHTLAMNVVVGALILMAIVGGAGILAEKGLSFLST
jgi:hypothetical protein